MLNAMRAKLIIVALDILCLGIPALAQNRMSALVPAYFYPGTEWTALDSAAATINVTAIMNPNSGPGTSADPNYAAAVANLRAAGGTSIGYVATGYGTRSLAAVTAEIDSYRTWYGGANGIHGIFMDEMANTGSAASLSYYRQIYNYVKAINPAWSVVGNPGTTTVESYLNGLSGRTADTLVVFEGSHASYASYTPSAWNANYGPINFANLIYDAPTATTMTSDIDLAAARFAGSTYVTNDVLPNPWDTLPPYFAQEVGKISQTSVPEPTGLLLIAAAGTLSWSGRRKRAQVRDALQGK